MVDGEKEPKKWRIEGRVCGVFLCCLAFPLDHLLVEDAIQSHSPFSILDHLFAFDLDHQRISTESDPREMEKESTEREWKEKRIRKE